MDSEKRNEFSLLCDDIVIYIAFFLPPQEIINLRLLDKYTFGILESCEYLWKTLLVTSDPETWKEYSNPPEAYESWKSCFLVHHNCLTDTKNKLCYRLFRKTTSIFQTRTHDVIVHCGDWWNGGRRREVYRELSVNDLHVRVFNFGGEEKTVVLSDLQIRGFLVDPKTNETLEFHLSTFYTPIEQPISIRKNATFMTYRSLEKKSGFNQVLHVKPFTSMDFFSDGSVKQSEIQEKFPSCNVDVDVEMLDFFIMIHGCKSKSNRISVCSDISVRGFDRSPRGVSKRLTKELEEYLKRKK